MAGKQHVSKCSSKYNEFVFLCCNKKPKNGYYICVRCHGVFHISCYDKIAPKAYKNNNKLVCKECEISVDSDDSKDEFYTKLIEELRSEGIHKEETIEKLNKKYEFYEDAITMENDFVSKIQNHIKPIDALQDELMNLKRECRNIKSTVFIITQTQTEINHIEQKKVDTGHTSKK
ncbi:hypothetical protein JTB14_022225 [Gonioctena quinquepunctata]|nr:hypothetical protein JTB14_022225 [Gonioctena quinquepunctata]